MAKLALVLIAALAPAIAHADKNYVSGKGGTWDCKNDPVINISHGSGTFTFTGPCKVLNLSGGTNKVTIDSVDNLNISGASNTVTVGEVATINLVGSGNTVTWKRAKSGDKPKITLVGTGNKVEGGGGAPAPAPAPAPTPAPAPPAAGDATVIDCMKQSKSTINDGGLKLRYIGACERIVINGGDNTLTVESVKSIAINGSMNAAEIDMTDKITVNGADNKVTYKRAINGAKPKISSVGEGNSITQK